MFLLPSLRFGWLLFGGGFMLLFWVAAILLLVLAVRGLVNRGNPRANVDAATGIPSNSALRILQERYARGEISQEDYDKMRRVLMTT
jgi:putative membrane protein